MANGSYGGSFGHTPQAVELLTSWMAKALTHPELSAVLLENLLTCYDGADLATTIGHQSEISWGSFLEASALVSGGALTLFTDFASLFMTPWEHCNAILHNSGVPTAIQQTRDGFDSQRSEH
eukprot:scaffold240551_cov67-Attheya_sp.AAC.6